MYVRTSILVSKRAYIVLAQYDLSIAAVYVYIHSSSQSYLKSKHEPLKKGNLSSTTIYERTYERSTLQLFHFYQTDYNTLIPIAKYSLDILQHEYDWYTVLRAHIKS